MPGQQFDYGFDDIGNRKRTKVGGDQSGANQRLANYSVNNLNQITARDYPGTNDIVGVAWVTNWVRVNGQTAWRKGEYFWSTVSADNHGQAQWVGVTVVSGGNTNKGNLYFPQTPEEFSYDADGNLSFDGIWNYQWDGENRLIEMTMTNVSGIANSNRLQLQFAYDYMGRRIQKIVSSWNGSSFTAQSTNLFMYDGWNLLATINPALSIQQSFMWGNDLSGTMTKAGGVGGLLMANLSGTNCFAGYDGNGNITALINAADKSTAARYEYSPYGELIRATGLLAHQNPFRFSTKFWDEESSLIFYGYRYYNPVIGKWTSRDPLEERDGINLLAFIHNNPISHIDTDGREDDLTSTLGSSVISATIDAFVDKGIEAILSGAKSALIDGYISSLHDSSLADIGAEAYKGFLRGGIEGAAGNITGLLGEGTLLQKTADATLTGYLSGAESGKFSKQAFGLGLVLGLTETGDKLLDSTAELAGSVGVDAAESIWSVAQSIKGDDGD